MLATAAKTMGLTHLDTLPQGISIVPHGDIELVISRKGQRVEHIGRRLFDVRTKEVNPSPVYDYLEYVWLDHTCKLSDDPFLLEGLRFEEGSWKALEQVNDSVSVSITIENRKRYRVEWKWPDDKRVSLAFPISYERLSVSTRQELENTLIADLQAMDSVIVKPEPQPIDKSALTAIDSMIWCEKGNHYMIDEINQNRYFQQAKKGMYEPVFDAEHPAESIANLFNRGLLCKPTYGIALKFRLYENRQQRLGASIDQLLTFFHQQGCKVYWGLERITDEEIDGTLMIVNESYGYHHVIGVTCPRQALFSDKCVMQGTVSLFIPSTNIGNIFNDASGKKNRIKWQ